MQMTLPSNVICFPAKSKCYNISNRQILTEAIGLVRFAPSCLASVIGSFSFEEELEISSSELSEVLMFVAIVAILKNVTLFANRWPQTEGEGMGHKVEY